MTTEGIIIATFTPLRGLTPFLKQYLETAVMPGTEAEAKVDAKSHFYPAGFVSSFVAMTVPRHPRVLWVLAAGVIGMFVANAAQAGLTPQKAEAAPRGPTSPTPAQRLQYV